MGTEDGKPGLGDLLSLTSKQGAAKMRGPAPATVVSYDRATQTCDARLLVYPKGGTKPPDIRQVPVFFLRGAGMSITMDLAPGDEVLLIPCEADIGAWIARGVTGEAPTARKASFADAIALAGIGSMKTKLAADAYEADALVVKADEIRLGSSAAADFVALASKVLTELQTIKTAYDLHVHPTPAGPSSPPTVPMTAPTSPAATKVKGE